jgi:CheY-like chemotaxis protein
MTAVLVVDDDQMFARAVGGDLRYQGFEVEVVHTVAAALESVSKQRFDVLLTDLRLGAQDGIDLLGLLREASPQTRAVLMSGFATARDYQRAVELGAVRVLCKPFTPADLIQCIQEAVECGVGFRGSFHGLSLVDMLQMYNYARRSVTIAVSGRSPGRMHLREGQLIHVEHAGQTGEPALATILAMPAGTLVTTPLPARVPQTVTRDFRHVLLDALRAIDEATAGSSDDDEDELTFDLYNDEPTGQTKALSHALLLQRTRKIDGYLGSCMFLAANGGVLGYDGSLDLRPAAHHTAEALRRKQQTITDMGLDDEALVMDLIVTSTSQYHLLRRVCSEVPAYIYLVLDRSRSNPHLAMLELEIAERSLNHS